MSRIFWALRHVQNKRGLLRQYGVVGIHAFEIYDAVHGYRLYHRVGGGHWEVMGNLETIEAAQRTAEDYIANEITRGRPANPGRGWLAG